MNHTHKRVVLSLLLFSLIGQHIECMNDSIAISTTNLLHINCDSVTLLAQLYSEKLPREIRNYIITLYSNLLLNYDFDLSKTLEGHTDSVCSLDFTSDGFTLATGSCDKTVRLWNVKTGKCIRELMGHSYAIESVAFRPDGVTLAAGSNNTEYPRYSNLYLWDLEKEVCTEPFLPVNRAHHLVDLLVFSSDGSTLAIVRQNGKVYVCDVETGLVPHSFECTGNSECTSAFGSDGSILVIGEWENLSLWDVKKGVMIREFTVDTELAEFISAVAFSPDGRTFATGGDYGTVCFYDVETDQPLKKLACDDESVHTSHKIYSLSFSPDGSILATGSYDGMVRLLAVETRLLLKKFVGDAPCHTLSMRTQYLLIESLVHRKGAGSPIYALKFSPDGSTLAIALSNGKVCLWTRSGNTHEWTTTRNEEAWKWYKEIGRLGLSSLETIQSVL